MLKLKNIKKTYTTGNFHQVALDDVSLKFRKNEFVAILGPSGSGKTTMLNIIGGLDRYESGDLIINNKSTKSFKDRNWDSYRNNCIGFVFQSYNLISHLTILDNVEMGMTLSGVKAKTRRKKALEVLEKVGLKEHAHKKPNQLSGGQMQRVAIARALANNPEIILADEPTGALDSKTSVQIMELIKEITKDKLVIMVTHNPDLANNYANRIVEMRDGKIISDSNPVSDNVASEEYKIKKTAMSFKTALKLSFNNIKTKIGRTFITSLASSIGIIGIALILSLSNGFDIQISKFERDSLSSMPIIISEAQMDSETINEIVNNQTEYELYPDDDVIYPLKSIEETISHTNVITQDYIDYLEKANSEYISGINYIRYTALNLFYKTTDGVEALDSQYFTSLPFSLGDKDNSYLDAHYDVLAGNMPENKEDLVLIVDTSNRVNSDLLESLGFDLEEDIHFEDLLGLEIKLAFNDSFYQDYGSYFMINTDYEAIYDDESNLTLKIAGILRLKEDENVTTIAGGLAYTEDLMQEVLTKNANSKIGVMQKNSDYNVLTGEKIQLPEIKEQLLNLLGVNSVPVMINIYPEDFDSKDFLLEYLDAYNENLDEEDKIYYTDMAVLLTDLSGGIMDAITIVLVAFSSISLVVSSIMIGIITYISVLERTKEIGLLRALGARNKDITRVFNAETLIIGFTSGVLGLIIAQLLTYPTNKIIKDLTDLSNVAQLNPYHALILLVISMLLTLIGGLIPAFMASKKDPVEALRTE